MTLEWVESLARLSEYFALGVSYFDSAVNFFIQTRILKYKNEHKAKVMAI
jgi:hypothetical protein